MKKIIVLMIIGLVLGVAWNLLLKRADEYFTLYECWGA